MRGFAPEGTRLIERLGLGSVFEVALVREKHGAAKVLVAFMDLVEEHLLATSVPDYH